MTCLPDVNVWVALALSGHLHQAAAKAWFNDTDADEISFCRVTQHGFLRLLTNSRVTGENVLSSRQAWATYDVFYQDPRVRFAEEPDGLEVAWRDATRHPHAGPSLWTDAYLSAFAAAAGFTIVTFDRAFRRHTGVNVQLLRAGQ